MLRFYNLHTINETDISYPDIYFTPEYGKACEYSDGAIWELCKYKDLIYVYLKKSIDFENNTYYDLITPYGYSGYYYENQNTYDEFIPIFRKEAKKRNYITEVLRQNPYLDIKIDNYEVLSSKLIYGCNYENKEEYLNKLNSLPEFVDQNLTNIRIGLEKGVSQPLVIFDGYESTYNDHITINHLDNYFYSPFKNLPNDISDIQEDSINRVAKLAIEQVVVPQFKRIKEFFETEYYPKTRTDIGVSSTPNGNEYYQNRINYYTTSKEYSAEKIHEIGLGEVARIKKEMEKIIEDLNFQGSFEDFFNFLRTDDQFYAKTPKELLMFARDIAKRADEQLPRFFKTLPRKPYGVAPVPDAIAPKYTGGRYVGTSKNSTDPGYYWVNTYDLKSRTLYTIPALTVHEAVPGHHLQGALNNELGNRIPSFRKNLYLSAYGEGWGLYTEYLAEEMGIYTTPYEHFGKLTYEMWRACRLVVDTGIHAFDWSKQMVLDYMSSNTALSLHEINTETDRYISWPGQALSYKIGELKIRELRSIAEKELGSDFDIREFHEIILSEGTVTLAILESRVLNYIEKANNE